MTHNPQNADKFDINQIERELKEISPWPWKVSNYRPYDIISRDPNESTYNHGDNNFTPINLNTKENAFFISKSPQRLAAAVERIRELEQGISRWCGSTEIRDLNIFMETLFDRIESLKKRHAEGCECPGCRNKLQMKLQGRL